MDDMELTIDLMDLLKRLLKKWKLIIAVAVAFAILGEAVGVIMDAKERKSTAEFMEKYGRSGGYYTRDVLAAAAELIPAENEYDVSAIEDVERAVNSYDAYKEQRSSVEQEFAASVLNRMSVDSNPSLELSYLVKIDSEEWDKLNVSRDAASVISYYRNYLGSNEILTGAGAAAGWQASAMYLDDLIVISDGTADMLVISILAPTAEECDAIASYYEETIEARYPEACKDLAGISFSVSKVSEIPSEQRGSIVMTKRNQRVAQLTTIDNNIVNLTKNFSAGQKTMYTEILSARYVIENGTDEEREELFSMAPDWIAGKMVVIFGVIGGILISGWLAVKYLFSSKLRTADDLVQPYGFRLLGTVEEAAAADQLAVVCADAAITAKKRNMEQLYLLDAGCGEEVCSAAAKLLEKRGVRVLSGGAATEKELDAFASCGGCLFLAKIDETKYADILKKIELAQRFEVPFIGAVAVR